jgi:hypothetical protein
MSVFSQVSRKMRIISEAMSIATSERDCGLQSRGQWSMQSHISFGIMTSPGLEVKRRRKQNCPRKASHNIWRLGAYAIRCTPFFAELFSSLHWPNERMRNSLCTILTRLTWSTILEYFQQPCAFRTCASEVLYLHLARLTSQVRMRVCQKG